VAARSRVLAVVALAAAAAVAATVGVTLLQTRGEHTSAPNGAVTKPRPGAPPLELDFGVRTDPEARALAAAATLYNAGKRTRAAAVFARYHSLEAEIGAAFAAWPKGGLDTLKHLVATHPASALAELHLGWAYYWSGRRADAVAAWNQAEKVEPDSPAAVSAEDVLHSSTMPAGLPFIVTTLKPASAVTSLAAAPELAALARAAARPDANAKILYGIALWNLRRPVSAEQQFVAAAALAPHDPMAQTAAAVGAFTKDDPVRAFGRLGPLTAVFPRSVVVRFHLGVLLLWTHSFAKARAQLRLAVADGPGTVYARQATKLLSALKTGGTK
jgi:tetratricopeptide (TPR) repeat protein